MNWEAIGTILEGVSALGVIISLLYVAKQLKTQNKAAQIAAMHEMTAAFREATLIFSDANLADIHMRGNKDFDSLSEGETLQILCVCLVFLRVWEEAFIRYEEGQLAERNWLPFKKHFQIIMGQETMQRI
ncbi:MAG: hypothetical protein JKX87_01320 [Cycloclasticus sp.]|nr:hypothetical protein [Cycloclasticus sp.]